MTKPITKPFTKGYILKKNSFYIKKAINNSIKVTFARMSDADNKQDVLETLDVLHKQLKLMTDFEKANQHLFEDKHDNKEK